jgi:pyruvate dehydrogenase E2 component (dihydrolipoamide acetyltransferase)
MHPEANCRVVFGGHVQRRQQFDLTVEAYTKDRGQAGLSGIKIDNADKLDVVGIARYVHEKVEHMRKERKERLFGLGLFLAGAMPPWIFYCVGWMASFLTVTLQLDLKFLGMPKDPWGTVLVGSMHSSDVDVGYGSLFPFGTCGAIVVVGRVWPRAVVRNGVVVPRLIGYYNFTVDHRVADGVTLGRLFHEIHEAFETFPQMYAET